MDFSEALKAMRMGSRVCRYEWFGKILHWNLLEKAGNESIIESRYMSRRAKIVKKLAAEDVLAKDWHIVT